MEIDQIKNTKNYNSEMMAKMMKDKNIKKIKNIIYNNNFNYNYVDDNGNNLLMLSIINKLFQITNILILKDNFNFLQINKDGDNVLSLCLLHNNHKCTLDVARNMKNNDMKYNYSYILFLATKYCNILLINFYLNNYINDNIICDYFDNYNETTLIYACYHKLNTIALMIAYNTKIYNHYSINKSNALIIASKNKMKNVVNYLLNKNDIKVNYYDSDNNNAFYYCRQNGMIKEAIKIFLKEDYIIDINNLSKYNDDIIFILNENLRIDKRNENILLKIIDVIIHNNVDIILNSFGKNLVFYICKHNYISSFIKLFVYNKNILEFLDDNNNNLLSITIIAKNNKFAYLLLQYMINHNFHHIITIENNDGSNSLFYAVQNYFNDLAIEMIQLNLFDINHKIYNDNSVLLYSALSENTLDIVRELVNRYDVNLNVVNNDGNNILSLLSYIGIINIDIIDSILNKDDNENIDKGLMTNNENHRGSNFIYILTLNNDCHMIKDKIGEYIEKYGIKVNVNILINFASNNMYELLEKYLFDEKYKYREEIKQNINKIDNNLNTLLNLLCSLKQNDIVLKLLDYDNINVNIFNIINNTPLHYACKYNLTDVAIKLLKNHNNHFLSLENNDNLTPLYYAYQNNMHSVIELIEKEYMRTIIKSLQSNRDDCVICYEKGKTKVKLLPCLHNIICYSCISKLVSTVCPLCRSTIDYVLLSDVNRTYDLLTFNKLFENGQHFVD